MKIRILPHTLLLACLLAAPALLCGQSRDTTATVYGPLAARPDSTGAGALLAPRAPLIPCATEEEALTGSPSPYVIPLNEWQRDTVPGGTRFTTRFKVRYTWNNRTVLLRTEDVSSSFGVAINGQPAGYCQTGSGHAEFDLTPWIRPDYNTVSLTVFDHAAASVLENGRESAPAGFRAASILSQPTVRIEDVFLTPTLGDGTCYIACDVAMQSHLLNPKACDIGYELLNPAGETVATARKTVHSTMLHCDTVRFVIAVTDPQLWNHETPHLYTLLLTNRNEGRLTECMAFRFGIRQPGCRDGVFLMNGRPVTLRGTRYAANENASLGIAHLQRLKREGYNCILADGRPQPDYFYAACDSLGLYVCDAADIDTSRQPERITKGGNPSNDPAWLNGYLDRLRRMYTGSHLHPSVVVYAPAHASRNGFCLYESYLALKAWVPETPIWYDGADSQWNTDLTAEALTAAPDPAAGREPVEVCVRPRDGRYAVELHNRMELTDLSLFYRIKARAGRLRSSRSGELLLPGNATTPILLDLPVVPAEEGKVQIELHVRKPVVRHEAADRTPRKVADLYQTSKTTVALPIRE